MKSKFKILILFLFIFWKISAQNQDITLLTKNKIALAICEYESFYGKYPKNPKDTASCGYYGQRRIYVAECNRICGYHRFDDTDRYDFNQATLMFFIYNNYWNPDWNYETISRVHACGFIALYNKNYGVNYWRAIQIILKKFDADYWKITKKYLAKYFIMHKN